MDGGVVLLVELIERQHNRQISRDIKVIPSWAGVVHCLGRAWLTSALD
jgi:hypothetical protein